MRMINKDLESIDVFKDLSAVTLSKLSHICTFKFKEKGEHLFLDKEKLSTIYIVLDGMVTLYKVNALGEKKIIFVLGKGKMINEVILQELPASISCEILEDARIACFSRVEFMKVMEQDFILTKAVIDSLSIKIRRLYRQLKNTSNNIRGDKRIAAKLWKLSIDYGVSCSLGTRIDFDLSITYFADMLGSKRETVSRQLKMLKEKNLVLYDKGKFIIPSQEELVKYFKSS